MFISPKSLKLHSKMKTSAVKFIRRIIMDEMKAAGWTAISSQVGSNH
ncbi:hypothetical protein PRIPAC_85988 [Pristionchus pacificus]|nr:hypothetical protein PRIPAC_85988 [Pristionchus pacificus]